MERERLQQIERLFHAALAVEENQRPDFLKEACGTDESLRREVESLLAYRSEAETFIEAPAMNLVVRGLAQDEVPRMPTTETVAVDPDRGLNARLGCPPMSAAIGSLGC
jgi:hypothetical protein